MNKLAYLNTNQVEQPFRQMPDLFYSVPKKGFYAWHKQWSVWGLTHAQMPQGIQSATQRLQVQVIYRCSFPFWVQWEEYLG